MVRQLPELRAKAMGIVALVCAALIFACGAIVYGGAMGPHAFATAAAILAEAALVLLVLDRVQTAQQHRDWRFVRQLVGQRMVAAMVDVVRLCNVRWNAIVLEANIERYPEFLRLAELHLADLRSNLEGLALAAEPADYEHARRIETRLGWLVRYLYERPPTASTPGAELPVVESTATLIRRYLLSGNDPTVALAFSSASEVVSANVDAHRGVRFAVQSDAFWQARMEAQTRLIDRRDPPTALPGILYDIDGDLAMSYFAVDCLLLEITGAREEAA
jgi:hypothetical protein